ncbi:MAG: hypothetical protein BGO26_02295 [Actinobacteria bacterium 69-20]|jgi:hypothetical protein|nr:hypothetical protein [Actinomycetota bacterium]OJV31296.1 MAG: hypothetical protein BGO26_02295 [Actinobacteria bacterium 69-20]
MWWVAWRQHRLQIAVLLAVMAAGAAALVILRSRIIAVYHEFGCPLFGSAGNNSGMGCVDAEGRQVWWNYGFSTRSSLAHTAMIAGPVVLGVFAAGPIFTREFGHGTQVLALTQSVGRARWFLAKITVMVVPLVGGLLALGYLMEWTDQAVEDTAYHGLNAPNFFARGIVPAATSLMAFGFAIAVGMYARNVVATLVVGMLASGAILAGVAIVQPDVLPAQRTVTPLADIYRPVTQAELDKQRSDAATDTVSSTVVDRNVLWVGGGYLDVNGRKISPSSSQWQACWEKADKAGNAAAIAVGVKPASNDGGTAVITSGSGAVAAQPAPGYQDSVEYVNASNRSMLDCMRSDGIAASYDDRLPGSKLWPLRWAMTGICVILAALFLALGAWRLRWAVAKR